MGAKKIKELIGLKEAVHVLNSHFQNDPAKSGRNVYSLGTLYNKISSGELKRHGPRHMVLVDKEELLQALG